MEKLPQNCIIINSVVYALVDDFEDGECHRCHFHELCTHRSIPCYLFDDEPDNKRFEKVGEITMPSFFITVDDIAQMMERKVRNPIVRNEHERR